MIEDFLPLPERDRDKTRSRLALAVVFVALAILLICAALALVAVERTGLDKTTDAVLKLKGKGGETAPVTPTAPAPESAELKQLQSDFAALDARVVQLAKAAEGEAALARQRDALADPYRHTDPAVVSYNAAKESHRQALAKLSADLRGDTPAARRAVVSPLREQAKAALARAASDATQLGEARAAVRALADELPN